MPGHRHLYRAGAIQLLARFSRKHPDLPYCNFVIAAYDELNPDRTSLPDDNFSVSESITGWLTPKPVQVRRGISDQVRVFMDQFNRPDRYARNYCDNHRLSWNKKDEHETRQLEVVSHEIEEEYPATARRPARTITMTYNYLEVLRGATAVNQLERKMRNVMDGLQRRIDSIQACRDVRAVERGIRLTLDENNEIENGGP